MKWQGFGVAFVLLALLSVAGWAVQYPVTVSSIDIEGTVKIKDRDVLEVLGFEVGDEVSESDLRAASQAIYDLGWFSEVAPEVGDAGDIVFNVVENPVVREIVITGNTHRIWYSAFGVRLVSLPIVPTSKIQQILYQAGVKKRKVLDRVALETGLNDVLTEYNDRGFVLIALGDVEMGETLRIEIVEGHVESNTVAGLDTVPAEVAEELIDLPLGEPLRSADIQRALARIRQSVYFTSVEVVPLAGSAQDSVILQWTLGERDLIAAPVLLDGIVLEGISRYPEETVYAELGEIPDEPIDNYGLLQILQGAYDLYSNAGYMMVRFAVDGMDGGTLHLRIDEGRIDQIVLTGNERTKDYVILRKLNLEVGQTLNRAAYLVGYQKLTSLGYFSSVDIAPEWVDDGLRITVGIKEKASLGGFEGQIALDPSTGGVVGELKVRQKNLFGMGQDVSLSYSRGLVGGESREVTWSLGYTSTAFVPEFDQVGFNIYRRVEEITEDEVTETLITNGATADFAYPLADYVNLGLTYMHEEERGTGGTNWTPTDSVTVSLMYDDANDPYFPTSGSRRSFGLEKAGGFAAGREYLNLGLTWTRFDSADLPVFGDMEQSFGVRFKMGWADDRLPASRYYELGGPASVRGMEPSSVPRMFIVNAEYRVELAEEGLYLITFVDTGVDLDSVRLDAVRATAGLELAINAVGIFVRLDAAWSLSSEWSWIPRFDFGFGPMF